MSKRGRHLRTETTVRRTRRVVVSGVQVMLILLALTVVGLPMATDFEWRTVVSGSMVPLVDPGDVILASPLGRPAEIGDVVIFDSPVHPGTDVVHRIVAFDGDGMVVTKGDANSAIDPWTVAPGAISGGLVLTVPKVGFAVDAVTSDAGIGLFLILPALAIIASEIPLWYRFIRYGKEAFEPTPSGRHLGLVT